MKRGVICFLLVLMSSAVSAVEKDMPEDAEQEATDEAAFEKRYGFRPLSARLASAGYMVDFRYRVTDPDKAWKVFQDTMKPTLTHHESGARLIVPSPAYVGPLAQTGEKPKQDRNYFIFFSNPGRLVEKGDKVTIHLGELVIGPLTIR